MATDPNPRLETLAGIVVRIGLNLQPGQPLLITDPYDLLGVHPEAQALAEAVRAAAGTDTVIVTAEPAGLRARFDQDDLRGYEAAVAHHTRRLHAHLARNGAFLFLTGSAPRLLAGVPADRLARFEAIKWAHLGPVIQMLVRGAGQWTLLPAPTSDWAAAAGTGLAGLWNHLFAALRLDATDPLAEWRLHLAGIGWQRDQFNAARHRCIRYTGSDIDLTLDLPRSHAWCTTQLSTLGGVAYVANLPTEEIFTAPHKASATGRLRVARPVIHGGTILDGIELEFRSGRVVRAGARSGEDYLLRLLTADRGAARIGEVAVVPGKDGLEWARRSHFHTLLDENSAHHIALGDAYRFCSRAWLPLAINSSQLHLDLPRDAEVELF
jgi:aminopeptidase